jgi:glycosyltransferase involved in cell wall biosynthesis
MNANGLPLVSIITPTYNRASYLQETIESVLHQTYHNIEYIVLDDGSTDNSQEILAKYGDRLTWETHLNMGEQRTVNKGWSKASGEFVMVVNSDDPVLPSLVESAVAVMQAHPEALVVYPDWYGINEKSSIIHEYRLRDYDYLEMVGFWLCYVGPGALMRHVALEIAPERTTKYHYVSDYEYWLRLGLHGSFIHLGESLATHRTHGDSAGISQVKLACGELINLTKDYFAWPDLPPEVRHLKRVATSAAYYQAAVRCAKYRRLSMRYALTALILHPSLKAPKPLPTFYKVGMVLLPESLHRFYWTIKARLPRRVRQWLAPIKHRIFGKPGQPPTFPEALLKRIESEWEDKGMPLAS